MLSTIRSLFPRRPRRKSARVSPRLQWLEERAVPSRTITVDDDRGQFRRADFTKISDAVAAARAGDTILVAAGTYSDQVVIPETLDGLKIQSAGGFRAVITGTGAGDGSGALVHVNGADDVRITGFAIDGRGGAATLEFGILVDNGGSATIAGNKITNIKTTPLGSSQGAAAIQIGRNATGAAGEAKITGNTISDYQKAGIVVIGAGSSAEVGHNTVKGAGPTNIIAQNGIQVSDGATGTVRGNTVTGNKYTGADFEGVGILIFNTANVRVEANHTSGNDEGILLDDVTGAKVRLNHATRNTFNGIGVLGGSGNEIAWNIASHNSFEGINLEATTGNTVEGNTALSNRRDGIRLEPTATGNTVRRNVAQLNTRFDISDGSTGTGTANTANLWQHNIARKKDPTGLR